MFMRKNIPKGAAMKKLTVIHPNQTCYRPLLPADSHWQSSLLRLSPFQLRLKLVSFFLDLLAAKVK